MVYFYKLLKLIVLLVLVTLLQNGDLKHQGGGGGGVMPGPQSFPVEEARQIRIVLATMWTRLDETNLLTNISE